MRGTHVAGAEGVEQSGIIPAYAGNTANPRRFSTCGRDHPRVCGEHKIGKEPMLFDTGSSPRMRGTLSCRVPHGASAGIIPAYAGNTQLHGLLIGQVGDHPRVCGEHSIVASV